MIEQNRLIWLKRILLVKVIVTLGAWGLPALLAPAAILPTFGLPIPDDPLFFRLFGGMAVTFGIAYWWAYQDPVGNAIIVKIGVIDNVLATLVVWVLALSAGAGSGFVWLSSLLTAFFAVSFWYLRPRPAHRARA